jgi:two-component system, chemotaxis family, protein-glutamate methylesterase/glutaminase
VHGKTKAAVVTGGGDRDTLARYSIVAIGGSAGSLESVRTILHGLPADFSSPILVVIHLHPDYVSHAAEILGRQTSLKVKDAQQHERLQPGVVYMAPTDHHLLVGAGLVELSTAASVNFSRPAIDRTFDSVVQAYGSKVIGVVLSGSGKDGSQGLRAIKQAGGFAIVQDPREARFTAMPAAAVSASAVDCVLPMQQIAPLLLKLSRMVQG